MKVGILTFHCANNYGAILQCYALQEFLKSMGNEVFVIDYRPDYIVNRYKVFSRRYWFVKNIKKTLKKLMTEPYLCCIRYRRKRNIDSFIINNYNLYPYQPGKSDLDAIVLGSDQIWNPKLTGKSFDPVFFGKGFDCRKISYAASNRSGSLTSEEEVFYRSHLSMLNNIGVRESTLQFLLQPLTDKKISLNIDPTLLTNRWVDKLTLIRPYESDYVMLYEVTRHLKSRQLSIEYSKQNGWSFVELTGALALSYKHTKNLKQTASPELFLSYLKYASCVFTTSFHGTALSILFEKDFYYIRQNTDSDLRIASLLDVLNLRNRMVDSTEIPRREPIVYDEIRDKLDTFRKSSIQYLKNALII